MEVCSWDWGAIAGFTGAIATIISPIIVACYLYEKWHSQKGKEVIATESKECINELFKIMKLYNDLKDFKFTSNEEFKYMINEFNSITYSSNAKLIFIKNCIKIEEDKKLIDAYLGLSNSIKKTIESYIKNEDKIVYIQFRIHLKTNNNDHWLQYGNSISHILDLCKSYALYKKDI